MFDKLAVLGLIAGGALSLQAAMSVVDVKALQRYPWNGLVDISYKVIGASDKAAAYFTLTDRDTGKSYEINPLDDRKALAKPGVHKFVWNPAYDGVRMMSTNVALTVTLRVSSAEDGGEYMVIDLSGGPDADSYPITYLHGRPVGGWSDEYKTTKLVLRMIPAGQTKVHSNLGQEVLIFDEPYALPPVNNDRAVQVRQSPWDYDYVPKANVSVGSHFYIGVFEVTQKQYELVMGRQPSSHRGEMHPVECASYFDIRNESGLEAQSVSSGSFMGRLRRRTGVLFDLPTEAQWVRGAFAGDESATPERPDSRVAYNLNDGKGGSAGAHTIVGSYTPNAWGLYDATGNVSEWCLDNFERYSGSLSKWIQRSSWAGGRVQEYCQFGWVFPYEVQEVSVRNGENAVEYYYRDELRYDRSWGEPPYFLNPLWAIFQVASADGGHDEAGQDDSDLGIRDGVPEIPWPELVIYSAEWAPMIREVMSYNPGGYHDSSWSEKTIRGGAHNNGLNIPMDFCSAECRTGMPAGFRCDSLGFRVCCPLPKKR